MLLKKSSGNYNNVKTNSTINYEDVNIVETLSQLQESINIVHKNLDYVTDEALIDSFIYELKSLHMRHQYYVTLAKQHSVAVN